MSLFVGLLDLLYSAGHSLEQFVNLRPEAVDNVFVTKGRGEV